MSISEHPPEADGPAPTPPPEQRPPSARTWIAAGVGAVVLTAGAIIGISAASSSSGDVATTGTPSAAASTGGTGAQGATGQAGSGMPGGRGTGGTISAVDGSTLTITSTQSGAATKVTTTDDTTVTLSDDATLADVEVGDHVVVSGQGDTSAITASRIVDSGDVAAIDGGPGGAPGAGPGAMGMPPEGAAPPDGATPLNGATPPAGGFGGMARASGTVASIDGDTIVVTTADGSVTVTTGSDTTVSTQRPASVSDLAVGDTIMVVGETTDGTVAATAIREGAMGFGGPRN